MARPVEFEYDKVLNNAMEQFWKEGYEASSVQKLLDCTGINRGTLYNSFGDKETFFKACVARYNEGIEKHLDSSLRNPQLAALDAISQYFEQAVLGLSNKHRNLGCLLVNSLCESINYDRDMKKLVRQSLATVRKGFEARLKEAGKAGQLRKGLTAGQGADLLMNCLHGLRVHSRDGASPKVLRSLFEFTLQSMRK